MVVFGPVAIQSPLNLRFLCGVLAASSILIANGVVAQEPFTNALQDIHPTVTTQVSWQVGQNHAPLMGASNVAIPSVPSQSFTQSSQDDPLKSNYPIPWTLIWSHQTQATQTGRPIVMRYRSATLKSPEGQIQAYSEIQVYCAPEASQSHISSELFLTTPQGQVLQRIPSSMHLSQGLTQETALQNVQGTMSILIPAVWSDNGERLLIRQFEAIFGSDVSSDYALVWNRDSQHTRTIAPAPLNYDTAILLGWSQNHPEQVLFKTTTMGESETALVAVDSKGNSVVATGDRPQQSKLFSPSPTQARR
ncbi:MAG TPA: hypothetical protein V6D19_10040 [Stenomitos sp.]